MSEDKTVVPVIRARGLAKTYAEGTSPVEVLKALDLEVAPRQTVAIIGASGSGKSTLLHLLGGLDDPTAGTVELMGQPVAGLSARALGELRNRALGFVYQFHHLLPEFSALENTMMPLLIAGRPRAEAAARATELLARVGLAGRADHRPARLSGGEQQRVAIVRAVANAPRVLLADEPTGNLDPRTADGVFGELMALVRNTGLAALVATHNPEIAARMDRTLVLKDGLLSQA